jgi:hypothetical protein
MWRVLMVIGMGACGFRAGGGSIDASNRTDGDATDSDAADASDAEVPPCGNGVVDPGEDCDGTAPVGCTNSCGDTGAASCSSCKRGPCVVTIDPATDWEVSTNVMQWSAVVLPHTGWGCTQCARYYRAKVCGRPSAVEFQWASDNGARMYANVTVAFDDYWLQNYCSDAPCCSKCCDTSANCRARLSAVHTFDTADLSVLQPGATNYVGWEVYNESGGSGFYSVVTVTY